MCCPQACLLSGPRHQGVTAEPIIIKVLLLIEIHSQHGNSAVQASDIFKAVSMLLELYFNHVNLGFSKCTCYFGSCCAKTFSLPTCKLTLGQDSLASLFKLWVPLWCNFLTCFVRTGVRSENDLSEESKRTG